MRQNHSILHSALLLTAANLVMRGVSMLFQVWLADAVGAAGLGLLQLIMTVYGFAMTVGTSGIRVAAMYLSAEEYGLRRFHGVRQAMGWCISCGLALSAAVGLVLAGSAEKIAVSWVQDIRAAASLRLLGLTLPLSCISAILSGYFTACNQVKRLVAVELADRFATVGLTAWLLTLGSYGDVEHACLSIVGGGVLASLGSVAVLTVMMVHNFRSAGRKKENLSMGKRLGRLCVPLALNDYLRSGLGTLEQFLIPRGLGRSGQSQEQALAAYGTIQGMVFPVMMFPSTVLFAVSDLLVPELARCRAERNQKRIDHLIGTCLRMGLLYAGIIAGLLFVLGRPLGLLIYSSEDAGSYLRIFAPMVLMLYMDCIVDGMHKGMGQQVYCVKVNTLTSFLDVIFLFILLPRFGITGYFISFLVTHAINFYLSIRKLLQLANAAPSLGFLALSGFCVCTGAAVTGLLLPQEIHWGTVIACGGIYLAITAFLLLVTGTWRQDDHRWLLHALRPKK